MLASFLGLGEETEFLRQRAQRLDDISGRIAARAARAARHALPAVPDRIAFEQLFDGVVVLGLHHVDDLARVVVVKLGRGADSRTDPAVHAGRQALFHADILHQHIEIFPHNSCPITCIFLHVTNLHPMCSMEQRG